MSIRSGLLLPESIIYKIYSYNPEHRILSRSVCREILMFQHKRIMFELLIEMECMF